MVHPNWEKRFKVVYQVYFAKEAAIMSTINAGTEITFTGDIKALQQMNVGSTSLSSTTSHKLGLDIQGQEGVIALGLFQIVKGGLFGTGKTKVDILANRQEPLEIKYTSNESSFEDDL